MPALLPRCAPACAAAGGASPRSSMRARPRPRSSAASCSLMSSQFSVRSFGRGLRRTSTKPPLQPRAGQRNFSSPLGERLGGVSVRLPSSPIPGLDRARPVLACRDRAEKSAYSSGWSSVRTASRLSAGSSDGPFGTAQLHSTPPCSSRKSQCKPAGGVLLHDKKQAVLAQGRGAWRRLRCRAIRRARWSGSRCRGRWSRDRAMGAQRYARRRRCGNSKRRGAAPGRRRVTGSPRRPRCIQMTSLRSNV